MSTTSHTSPLSPPPGQQDQSARLAASAEAPGQEGGTNAQDKNRAQWQEIAAFLQEQGVSVKGFPAPADCLDQFGRVVRESLILEQLSLVAKSGDGQFPVLAGNALQLFANELADKNSHFGGHDSGFLEGCDRSLIDSVFSSYGSTFVLLVHVLSSDGKDGHYSIAEQAAAPVVAHEPVGGDCGECTQLAVYRADFTEFRRLTALAHDTMEVPFRDWSKGGFVLAALANYRAPCESSEESERLFELLRYHAAVCIGAGC